MHSILCVISLAILVAAKFLSSQVALMLLIVLPIAVLLLYYLATATKRSNRFAIGAAVAQHGKAIFSWIFRAGAEQTSGNVDTLHRVMDGNCWVSVPWGCLSLSLSPPLPMYLLVLRLGHCYIQGDNVACRVQCVIAVTRTSVR